MSDQSGTSQDSTRPLGLPIALDLLGIVAAVVATGVVIFTPLIRTTPLRIVLGIAFVLFVPGYAFIAALFPEKSVGNKSDPASGIDGIERVALSFGSSIALVPLVGILLDYTPWGIRLVPIFVSLAGLTLGLTAIAMVRRRQLPPTQRGQIPTGWTQWIRGKLFEPDDRIDLVLNTALIVSVLLAISSVGYAITAPSQGESFTEFSLLTENENGELVADDYPTNFTVGESQSLVVSATNQEGHSMNYTIVVELQQVTASDGTFQAQETDRLYLFTPQIQAGETWRRAHLITPSITGERLRLQYRLYRGSPSVEEDTEPYRSLHLWVSAANMTTAQSNSTVKDSTPEDT
jgi:uncharacterized membrane protein